MDAKTLLALANLNKRDRYLEKSVAQSIAPKRDWRWVGYDATTGQGIVSNGVITGRGKVITNGSIVPGEIVSYSQDGEFAVIEAKPYVRPKPAPKPQYVPPIVEATQIALLYAQGSGQSQSVFVGAIGPDPIAVPRLSTTGQITKTADGWISSIANSVSVSVYTGNESDINNIWEQTPLIAYKTPTYVGAQASFGRLYATNHLGYGYVAANSFWWVENLPVDGWGQSKYADGTTSDNLVSGTKTNSWSDGFFASGTATLISNSVTAVATTQSVSASASGQIPMPDGTTKSASISHSDTVRSGSGGVTNISSNHVALALASGSTNNFIMLSSANTLTDAFPRASATVSTETYSYIWKYNGVETVIATRSNNSGTLSTSGPWDAISLVLTSQSSSITSDSYGANLIDDKLYFVNMAASNPETGIYSVDVYQLPAMTKTTESVSGSPIAGYVANNSYHISASYHP